MESPTLLNTKDKSDLTLDNSLINQNKNQNPPSSSHPYQSKEHKTMYSGDSEEEEEAQMLLNNGGTTNIELRRNELEQQ